MKTNEHIHQEMETRLLRRNYEEWFNYFCFIYLLLLSRQPYRRGLFGFRQYDPAWLCSLSDLIWFNVKYPDKPIDTGSNNFSLTQTNHIHKKKKKRKKGKKETVLTWWLLGVNHFVTQSEGKGEKEKKEKRDWKVWYLGASYLTKKKLWFFRIVGRSFSCF